MNSATALRPRFHFPINALSRRSHRRLRSVNLSDFPAPESFSGSSESSFGASENSPGANRNHSGANRNDFPTKGNLSGSQENSFGSQENGFGCEGNRFGCQENGFPTSGNVSGSSENDFLASENHFPTQENDFRTLVREFHASENAFLATVYAFRSLKLRLGKGLWAVAETAKPRSTAVSTRLESPHGCRTFFRARPQPAVEYQFGCGKEMPCDDLFRKTRTDTKKEASMKSVGTKKTLPPEQREELLGTLKTRFEKNMNRHQGLEWAKVKARLEANAGKLWSLHEMESTGGEPDVVGQDKKSGEYIFFDCSEQTPEGRVSLCYDREALDSRKEHKPKSSVMDMAAAMGIEVLTEEQYLELQKLGEFDTKRSSWVKTPADIRKLGGALYGDRRYGRVFVGHNGAESYYSGRGFRGWLRV